MTKNHLLQVGGAPEPSETRSACEGLPQKGVPFLFTITEVGFLNSGSLLPAQHSGEGMSSVLFI